MNRLWIWISVVIVGVVLIVALFPFLHRIITQANPPRQFEGGPFDGRNPEEVRRMMERAFWSNISRTLAVGAVVGLVTGILLTRWLVAPLRQLEGGARAVARRELDHRVPERGSREFRSVARSFNHMAVELERQEILRRSMLADVTHELRHPIHIIQGNLQAILDSVYPLSMEEIDRLLEQTQNLTALVDDLHELALAEARELPLHRRETNLAALLAETTERFQSMASNKSIQIGLDLPAGEMISRLDPDRIRQALGNLLGNALRYTPEGGAVEVALERRENDDLISVRDTGVGIPAEDLPKVFDRFYRGDASRNRKLPGMGLGLPIAQALVQAHGGQIEVESAGSGKGSTFVMRLPRD
jgi:two-component system sensor histidine kinase BaeS